MKKHLFSSLFALTLVALFSSIAYINNSSIARASNPIDLQITPLAQIADSLHEVTIELDVVIAEMTAEDSAVLRSITLPAMSAELRARARSFNSTGSAITISLRPDAFQLTNRIEQQRAYMQFLSTSIEDRKKILDALPTLVPCSGRHTSPFGNRVHPIHGVVKKHEGIDLAAPTGTPIHAAGKGVVVFSGVRNGYGNTLEIDHGNGYRTLYAHTSKLLVKQGDTVERGALVALVGSTGASTGSHLHYEVIVDGHKVDPDGFLLDGIEQVIKSDEIAEIAVK